MNKQVVYSPFLPVYKESSGVTLVLVLYSVGRLNTSSRVNCWVPYWEKVPEFEKIDMLILIQLLKSISHSLQVTEEF